MNDGEILEKVKEYLQLDTEHDEKEIRLYAEQLLFWIKQWTEDAESDLINRHEESDGQPDWEQEWEDFGEVYDDEPNTL